MAKTNSRSTGWDNQEIKELSWEEKIAEAYAVQHNLMIRLGAVGSTSADGVSLTRQLNLLKDYIQQLEQKASFEQCNALQWNTISEVI